MATAMGTVTARVSDPVARQDEGRSSRTALRLVCCSACADRELPLVALDQRFPLGLGHASPDAVGRVHSECVLTAEPQHRARLADRLRAGFAPRPRLTAFTV